MEIPRSLRMAAITTSATAVAFAAPELAEGAPHKTKREYCHDQVRDRDSIRFGYEGLSDGDAWARGSLDKQDPQCKNTEQRTSASIGLMESTANGTVIGPVTDRERVIGSGFLRFNRHFDLEKCDADQVSRFILLRINFTSKADGKQVTQIVDSKPLKQNC